jgi:hypothetical protein
MDADRRTAAAAEDEAAEMGSPNAMCPPKQQVCVLDAAACLPVAASTSGALTPHSETSTNAAAMNLVLIPILPDCHRVARQEIRPL